MRHSVQASPARRRPTFHHLAIGLLAASAAIAALPALAQPTPRQLAEQERDARKREADEERRKRQSAELELRELQEKFRRQTGTVGDVSKLFPGPAIDIFKGDTLAGMSKEQIAKLLAKFIYESKFERNPTFYTDANGLYGQWTDVVESLKQKKHIAGQWHNAVAWSGAIWLFSSRENALQFINDPERFSPMYGGHCAHCLTQGSYVGGNVIEVYENRLYVFSSDKTAQYWRENFASMKSKADQIWPLLPIARLAPMSNSDVGDLVGAELLALRKR